MMGPPADPRDGWVVHNDKLYVNINSEYRTKFRDNLEANIASGDKNWLDMWGDEDAGPFHPLCLPYTDGRCAGENSDANMAGFQNADGGDGGTGGGPDGPVDDPIGPDDPGPVTPPLHDGAPTPPLLDPLDDPGKLVTRSPEKDPGLKDGDDLILSRLRGRA